MNRYLVKIFFVVKIKINLCEKRNVIDILWFRVGNMKFLYVIVV